MKNDVNKTAWNQFYEDAWSARKAVMQDIIDSGIKNPLSVINKFESIMRLSKQSRQDDGSFSYELYGKVPEERVCNVKSSDGGLEIKPNGKLPHGLDALRQMSVINNEVNVPFYAIVEKVDFLMDFIADTKYDAIIELGSGYSRNLVRLFYHGGPRVPYYGGEYTESGTETAEILGSLDDEFDLRPFMFDYKNPDFSSIGKHEDVLVFTNHSIEQVQAIPDDLLKKIGGIAKNVTCVHMEPFGYQLASAGAESNVDKMHRNGFVQKGWNQNLASVLLKSHLDKDIELTYLKKNVLGGMDLYNPTSLAVWHSI